MSDGAADFDRTLEELRRIVETIDARDIDLDEAMSLFEQGMSRVKELRALLDTNRGRVEELIRDASGESSTVEWDPPKG